MCIRDSNDTLHEKFTKLKEKQFPLLHHHTAKDALSDVTIPEVKQALCFLASLFVPIDFEGSFEPSFEQSIRGYYLNHQAFEARNHHGKSYYVPPKKEWGIEPSSRDRWLPFEKVSESLQQTIKERQSTLVWQQEGEEYTCFFVVWW